MSYNVTRHTTQRWCSTASNEIDLLISGLFYRWFNCTQHKHWESFVALCQLLWRVRDNCMWSYERELFTLKTKRKSGGRLVKLFFFFFRLMKIITREVVWKAKWKITYGLGQKYHSGYFVVICELLSLWIYLLYNIGLCET